MIPWRRLARPWRGRFRVASNFAASARARGVACAAAVVAAFTLASGSARAQTAIPDTDWRQTDRTDALHESGGSPQNFAFEVRFGGYRPDVDSSFASSGSSKTPYETIFGNTQRFYFGLELDWQAARIPYVGVIGPGIGWGYTQSNALAPSKASYQSGASYDAAMKSGENTSLAIMPMHVSAVIRFDEIMRRYDVPVVPYAKLGLAMATWSAANTAGVSTWTDPKTGASVQGRGITWGEQFALGAMLSLNFLDERAAARLDQGTGVNHTYLMAEWMDAHLDGIGSKPQMHVGSSTWVLGLAIDL